MHYQAKTRSERALRRDTALFHTVQGYCTLEFDLFIGAAQKNAAHAHTQ